MSDHNSRSIVRHWCIVCGAAKSPKEPCPACALLDAAKDALAFIDRVEGHGYGGEADHMVAQVKLREAIKGASTETAEQRSERILLSAP